MKCILLQSRLCEIRRIAESMPATSTVQLENLIKDLDHSVTYRTIKRKARGFVTVDKRVVIDRDKAYGRGLNFVLAHELGHIVLNHFNRESEHYKKKGGEGTYSIEFEQEANFFAGYILVPTEVIDHGASYWMHGKDDGTRCLESKRKEVENKCLGSRQCIDYRIDEYVRYCLGQAMGIEAE